MEMGNIIEYLMTPVAQVALIIGLAEIAKGFEIQNRWIPLVDLALGLTSGIFVYHFVYYYDFIPSAVIGIFLGLSACGLFSGYKNVMDK